MKIRCVALDLDRTTLRTDGSLSPGTTSVLRQLIDRGIHVVIASGRSFATLPECVLAIEGIEFAITSNGAAVYHVPTGRCVHSYQLNPCSVEEILRLTESEPVTYEAFVEGRAYADAAYVRDPERFGASSNAVAYVQRTRHMEEDIVGFIRNHIDVLDSVDVIVRNLDEKNRIQAILRAAISDIYTTSSVPQLLEISHQDAGKHSGIRYIAELLQIPKEEIAAFGDGENDADMLAYVGVGIAVENAVPSCKAAADWITRSNDADGVAFAIRTYLNLLDE